VINATRQRRRIENAMDKMFSLRLRLNHFKLVTLNVFPFQAYRFDGQYAASPIHAFTRVYAYFNSCVR